MVSYSVLKGGLSGRRRLVPVPSMKEEMVYAPRKTVFLLRKAGVQAKPTRGCQSFVKPWYRERLLPSWPASINAPVQGSKFDCRFFTSTHGV